MSYAIARLSKLKLHQIGGSAAHTSRDRETPNADSDQQNIRLIGIDAPDVKLEDLVMAKIAEQPQRRKIRSDGIYCVEFLLTASPEYFRPQCPTQAGYYEQERLDQWAEVNRQWLFQEYGDRIVRAELHLDEATPHIHAYFVPLDEEGQLRCNHFFNGREKIQRFQDSYFNAMLPIGLERGIKGSRAQHYDIKSFYRIVEEGLNSELNLDQLKAKAAERDQLAQRKQELELTAKALAQHLEKLEAENLQWKQQVEQLHDLPIETVAWRLGMEPSRSIRGRWYGYNGEVDLEQSGSAMAKHPPLAIALIMQVNDCNYPQAIAWVHDEFGELAVERAVIAYAKSQALEIANSEPRPRFIPPVEDKNRWPVVQDYLTQEYLLPIHLVQNFHEQGLIYSDGQNVTFLMRQLESGDPTGALLQQIDTNNTFVAKGTKRTESWFHFYLGGKREDEIQKAILCQSPVEALSYVAVAGIPSVRTLYLVADDKNLPIDFLKTIPKIQIAYANDAAKAVGKILSKTTRIKQQAGDSRKEIQELTRSSYQRKQEEWER
jgi:hypothetical protein